jgi:hypothetical protein
MIQIKSIRLRRWFPPGDPVATAVAMLCILREDLFLELQGIVSDGLAKLDDNSAGYRRTYFWRNFLRTLEEIKDVLSTLNKQSSFRAALSQEPAESQQALRAVSKTLNKASRTFLRELRNKIGGHLDEPLIRHALEYMHPYREGLFQVGDIRDKIRYKFAGEILWAAVLRGVPPEQEETKVEEILKRSADLMQVAAAIDDVIASYARSRRLR